MTKTLCKLFVESATRFPDRQAIIQGESSISYQRLSAWAASIETYLRNNGLRQGDRVGILLQNTAEYVAIYYGILAAGGVVVSLNTATRARDLTNWLMHSEVSWLFAEASHAEFEATLQSIPAAINVVEVGDSASNSAVSQHINLAVILADDHGQLKNPETIRDTDLAAII